jgi:hypothetical protein
LKADLMAARLKGARLQAAIAGNGDPTLGFQPPIGAPREAIEMQRRLLASQVAEQQAWGAGLVLVVIPCICGFAQPSTADRGLRLGRPPCHLIRDRAYYAAFIRRIRAMGIRDRPVSAQSARSDGNVLITSSSLASAIFATFSHRTKNTTMGRNAPIAAEGHAGSA